MRNFNEKLSDRVNGHLEVQLHWKDGRKETVFDDHNIIVDGFGFTLAQVFTGSGLTLITEALIDRFQIGVSGNAGAEDVGTRELSASLSSADEYGTATKLYLVSASQRGDSPLTNQVFGKIPYDHITRPTDTSVRYTIVLDEGACVDLTRGGDVDINEIALFSRNPTGATPEESVMCAYRNFSPIRKTNEFSVVFNWTLNF